MASKCGLLLFVATIQVLIVAAAVFNGIRSGYTKVPTGQFNSNIDQILLGQNSIERILWDDFQKTPELTAFFVTENPVKTIANGAFQRTPKLERLGLRGCQLTGFPNLVYVHGSLIELHMSNNLITKFTREDVHGFTKLQMLDLSRNPIASFPDMRYILPSLKTFNMQGIGFNCCLPLYQLKHPVLVIDAAPCAYPDHITDRLCLLESRFRKFRWNHRLEIKAGYSSSLGGTACQEGIFGPTCSH
ncbi:hypothetical protein CAPTEDRAFT_187326 [Capitella teleta]|uniref:LRRCT domain-containing protein n=1 Tax=Capitella teleta TaxID=283909 RepID=X1ZK53_CAPTE|nr:hypothetical protein CAPTEDRAFT_187326 [Capitella teleta]|eukprot:ELU10157.1 hypothetical protein CAPTEDRAFT_187326 [Capitella teleta]